MVAGVSRRGFRDRVRVARLGCVVVLALLAAAPARAQTTPDLPTVGLVHEAVTSGRRGGSISIDVGVQSELAFDKLVLAYRPEGETEFRGREMNRVEGGAYHAEIPLQGTAGTTVAYYIEAQDKDGAPVAGRASAQSPLVIQLTGPPPAVDASEDLGADEGDDRASARRRYFVALLVGSGAGWATGTGDTNTDTRTSGVSRARLGQLVPELGYWMTPTLMLSGQGRFQVVTGTTDVYSEGRVYHTASYAAAGFLKATWFAPGVARVRPFFSLAAGGGQIRHVVTFGSLKSCGPAQDQACVDTIAAGPVAVGPGGGLLVELGAGLAAVFQLDTQLTFPTFSFNVDANLGLALEL
jgi:hypothetical protein